MYVKIQNLREKIAKIDLKIISLEKRIKNLRFDIWLRNSTFPKDKRAGLHGDYLQNDLLVSTDQLKVLYNIKRSLLNSLKKVQQKELKVKTIQISNLDNLKIR